ncbi:MAG: fumarate hydratase [Kiritimatiellaeota bacterium]|nr:fumarate hydratase [Kiritimatiellota bacterium]
MNAPLHEKAFQRAVLQLIKLASTDLSADVVDALRRAADAEAADSPAHRVLALILENIRSAREQVTPICQDTGTCNFHVTLPVGFSLRQVERLIQEATREAVRQSFLRPNAVDPSTGKNSGDNVGRWAPWINFSEGDNAAIQVQLLLKGGGSENVSCQYALPQASLGAGRNLDGVYKCVVDAVTRAQGQGCAPGIIGVGIGGDRATGMLVAKQQLFRSLGDENDLPVLRDLEAQLFHDLNTLGIGPMGFGGKTTVLGVKIGSAHRTPASFFVSVAYMCWAARRRTMVFSGEEATYA